MSSLDVNDDEYQQEASSFSSLDALLDASNSKDDTGPSRQVGSQAQPLEISFSHEGDGKRRRSSRVRRATRIESQLQQIEKGPISAPGARAKVRALNAKKKRNTKASQLGHELKLIE